MQDLIAKQASNLGLSYDHVTSGAGHDAGEIAALSPACADGVNVLLQAVVELANAS